VAEALRDWPEGTVCVLVTGTRAIPVSTAVRVDDTTVRFGLGRRRGSLARLRDDAQCALVVIAEGVAVTLYGTAREAGEVGGVVAVEMDVREVVDHMTEDFAIRAGVAWEWTDAAAAARDHEVRAGLRR
jgi:hypothetical protein